MKLPLTLIDMVILSTTLTSVGWAACNSYEECMSGKNECEESTCVRVAYPDELRAIAYKLAEISEKLDKHQELVIHDKSGIKVMNLEDTASCSNEELGWDGACHKGDLDEYAYSDNCKGNPSIKEDLTWKKAEIDGFWVWSKAGCYQLKESKEPNKLAPNKHDVKDDYHKLFEYCSNHNLEECCKATGNVNFGLCKDAKPK